MQEREDERVARMLQKKLNTKKSSSQE